MLYSDSFILTKDSRSGIQSSMLPHGMDKETAINTAKDQLTNPDDYKIILTGMVDDVADGSNGFIECLPK